MTETIGDKYFGNPMLDSRFLAKMPEALYQVAGDAAPQVARLFIEYLPFEMAMSKSLYRPTVGVSFPWPEMTLPTGAVRLRPSVQLVQANVMEQFAEAMKVVHDA